MQIEKYTNIKDVIPKLNDTLIVSIQHDVLEIKTLLKNSHKFHDIEGHDLEKAHYVIFSKHIPKQLHNCEMFIFTDITGQMLLTKNGCDLDLYDMIENIKELKISEDFRYKDNNS